MAEARIAIIGGSGFYDIEGLKDQREVRCETPFGDPSDAIMLGTLGAMPVAFLPRHGRGHRLLPTEVPARANVYALKTLGVERIISVNAVGSLRDDIAPRDLVVPDQLIDRTVGPPEHLLRRRPRRLTSPWPTPSARSSAVSSSKERDRPAQRSTKAARRSSSKGRRSPPRRSRTSTAPGAPTSSA